MARIMIASTDDVMRRYLSEKLKRAGHFITRVSDYDVALTILCETYHDVLIAEIGHDDTEGLTFAQEARRIDPEMQVIFQTGFALVPLETRDDDEEGFYDRLGAPTHLNQLVDEVSRVLVA